MKSRKEVYDFIENTYPLIGALRELPFLRNDEYGVYMKVKFKPVFYVRRSVPSARCDTRRNWLRRGKPTAAGDRGDAARLYDLSAVQ